VEGCQHKDEMKKRIRINNTVSFVLNHSLAPIIVITIFEGAFFLINHVLNISESEERKKNKATKLLGLLELLKQQQHNDSAQLFFFFFE
jgi:hypothetical protein